MRAQVSSEFMVVFSALLMVFVVMYVIFFGGNLNLSHVQESVSAQRDAKAAAAAINFVYLAGDGARYNLSLKNLAAGENITASGYSLTAEKGHASASAPLIVGGANISSIGAGDNLVMNEGGVIHVSR